MIRISYGDRGISAIWVAVIFLFLAGAAALAVDASGGFNAARTDQNTADLACLAGVRELPESSDDAISTTVDYVVANWPEMASQTLNKTGTTATYSDGSGNEVYIDAGYGGDTSKEYVRVREVRPTFFAKLVGSDTIAVTQEAWCRVTALGAGGGSLPFAAFPGGFDGNLQDFNPCPGGNCGPIDIPRDTPNGGGPQFIENLATGSDRLLDAWLGPIGSPPPGAVVCNTVTAGQTCHILTTNNGVSAGQLGEGAARRLQDYVGAPDTGGPGDDFTSKGVFMNGDTPGGVLTGDNTNSLPLLTNVFPIGSPPAWWDTPEEESLYGPYDLTNTANHYYYNGDLAFCDHPRLGFIPIVTDDMDWNLGDGPASFNGNTTVKVVGFLWVIIIDPNDPGDFYGNNNLKNASSIVVWFGPNADECGPTGSERPFDPTTPGLYSKEVALVNESA